MLKTLSSGTVTTPEPAQTQHSGAQIHRRRRDLYIEHIPPPVLVSFSFEEEPFVFHFLPFRDSLINTPKDIF